MLFYIVFSIFHHLGLVFFLHALLKGTLSAEVAASLFQPIFPACLDLAE